MLERTKVRALPVLNRAAELAPAAQTCCGACRTCVTTNIFALAGAGIAGAALYLRRVVMRPARTSAP
jgi:hypothetical protein